MLRSFIATCTTVVKVAERRCDHVNNRVYNSFKSGKFSSKVSPSRILLNKHFVYSGDDDIVGRISKDDGEGRNENKGRIKSDFGFFQYFIAIILIHFVTCR